MSGAALVLGTAQFAPEVYGVTNARGRLALDEVAGIVGRAEHHGVRMVDTAADYEGVELLLGGLLPEGFDVVTKVGSPGTGAAADHVLHSVARSLERLGRPSVHGVLLHRAADAADPAVVAALTEVRTRGWARRVGVSVYDVDELRRVLDVFTPDLVQVPLNLFDQRLVAAGVLPELADAGVEVHVRSVFLQGLLLADPAALPVALRPLADHLDRCRRLVTAAGSTMAEAAVAFVLGQPGVSAAVVGVTSEAELDEVVRAVAAGTTGVWDHFAVDDDRYIDPRRW